MKLVVVEKTDELTYVALEGRLDIAGVQEVQVTFLAQTAAIAKPTIINMAKVTFLASLGIRMLLSCAKALRRRGLPLVIVKPQPFAEKALALAGLDRVLTITHSEWEAVQLLRQARPQANPSKT